MQLADTFCAKLRRIRPTKSLLCVGLDPSVSQLRAWGLPESAAGAREFSMRILDACSDLVGVFKPQAAYFEQFGAAGFAVAAEVISSIRNQDAVSVFDCKRGDIGNTMAAYATGILGPRSPMGADAMTVTAYLGYDALAPVIAQARQSGTTVFVVVRSSNPEGNMLQLAKTADGETVAQSLAGKIAAENHASGRKLMGAVVGATLAPDEGRSTPLLATLKDAWILAPGIGAQGAAIDELPLLFGQKTLNVLPSVSRAVAAAGPERSSIRSKVQLYREQLLRQYDLCQ